MAKLRTTPLPLTCTFTPNTYDMFRCPCGGLPHSFCQDPACRVPGHFHIHVTAYMHVDMHACTLRGMGESWSVLVPDKYRPAVGEAIARGEDWMVACPEAVGFARDALLGMCEEQVRFARLQLANAERCGEAPDPRWASELRQSTALAARILGLSGVRRGAGVEDAPSTGEVSPDSARRMVLAALEAASKAS